MVSRKCFVCGDGRAIALGSSRKDSEALKSWRVSWASSLCSLLDIDTCHQGLFLEASFCATCLDIVCHTESTLMAMSRLQLRLSHFKHLLENLLVKNYAPCHKSPSSGPVDMDLVLKNIGLGHNAEIVTSPSDPLEPDSHEMDLELREPDAKRLKRLKERLAHAQSENTAKVSKLCVSPSANQESESVDWDYCDTSEEIKVEVELEELPTMQDLVATDCCEAELCATEDDLEEFPTPEETYHFISSFNVPPKIEILPQVSNVPDDDVRFICNHGDCLAKNVSFAHPHLVRLHSRTVHPEEHGAEDTPFHCDQCQLRFAAPQILKSHKLGIHARRRPSKGTEKNSKEKEIQRKTLSLKGSLSQRIPSWTPKQRVLGYICNHGDCVAENVAFARPRLLIAHCEEKHAGEGLEETPYHCKDCAQRFPGAKLLSDHVQDSHPEPGTKLHYCSKCLEHYLCTFSEHRQSCAAVRAAECGQRLPNGEMPPPAPCAICGKSWKGIKFTRSDIQRHADLHLNRDPMICVLCPQGAKPFRVQKALRRHVSVFHDTHLVRNKRKRSSIRNLFKFRQPGSAHASPKKDAPEPTATACIFPTCRNFVFSTPPLLRNHLMSVHKLNRVDAQFFVDKNSSKSCENSEEKKNGETTTSKKLRQDSLSVGLDDNAGFDDWVPLGSERKVEKVKSCGRNTKNSRKSFESCRKLAKSCRKDKDSRVNSKESRRKLRKVRKNTYVGRPSICPKCGLAHRSRLSMEAHMTLMHKTTKCGICTKSFEGNTEETKVALRAHELLHEDLTHLRRPFDCVLCDKKLRSTFDLQEHVHCDHENLTYKCERESCAKRFEFEFQYKKHMGNHTRKDSNLLKCHKCTECDYTNHSTLLLRYHFEQKHCTERIPCSVEGCTATFGLRQRLMRHLKQAHGIGNFTTFACRICGKEFRRRAAIVKHEQCHGTERPFVCEICGAAFKTESNLRQHGKVHDPNKTTGNNWKLQQPRKPRLKTSPNEKTPVKEPKRSRKRAEKEQEAEAPPLFHAEQPIRNEIPVAPPPLPQFPQLNHFGMPVDTRIWPQYPFY